MLIRPIAESTKPMQQRLDAALATPPKMKKNPSIPNRNCLFTARKDELDSIEKWVVDGQIKIFTIWAIGGIGKSSLAVEACHKIKDKFLSGIFWLTSNDESVDSVTTSFYVHCEDCYLKYLAIRYILTKVLRINFLLLP